MLWLLCQMTEKIRELEKVALSDKPWQLAGEATAQSRPENSMLGENVDFEQTSRKGRWSALAAHRKPLKVYLPCLFGLVMSIFPSS